MPKNVNLMKELICSLHIHSTYSDGSGHYADILKAAAQTGVDAVILTDHNVLVKGVEGTYEFSGKKVLFLTGEEVHNQDRDPQKNHLLVFGAGKEMATYAYDPQKLLDEVKAAGGIAFLAHPYEFALPLFHEDDISWVDWQVEGFTGLELWNGLSELKTVSQTIPRLLKNAFFPESMAVGPLAVTLRRWDELLATGKHIHVVGGVDAHNLIIPIGPFKKEIFPYAFHFSTISNHLLVNEELSGDLARDEQIIYTALRNGSSFVGYDLPASTRGFTFKIVNETQEANLGETLTLTNGATAHIHLPRKAEIRLIHNGNVLYESKGNNVMACTLSEPGAYRVECYLNFLGRRRGWIFSNPIYVTKEK